MARRPSVAFGGVNLRGGLEEPKPFRLVEPKPFQVAPVRGGLQGRNPADLPGVARATVCLRGRSLSD
jgi:hypothetical protein